MNDIQDSLTIGEKVNITYHSLIWGSPVMLFFETFIFKDWSFLISVILLVCLDSMTGGISALLKGDFSGVIFLKKLSMKLFALAVVIVCVGVVKNTVIGGSENFLASWVDSMLYSVLIGFEGTSVLKNLYKIYPFEPIRLLLEKFEVYYHKKIEEKTHENDQPGGDRFTPSF